MRYEAANGGINGRVSIDEARREAPKAPGLWQDKIMAARSQASLNEKRKHLEEKRGVMKAWILARATASVPLPN